MTSSHSLGVTLGLGLGIACIFAGLQGKADTIWISHPLNQGETVRVPAVLVPFVGMERQPLEATCQSPQECDALEERLQAMGYAPH